MAFLQEAPCCSECSSNISSGQELRTLAGLITCLDYRLMTQFLCGCSKCSKLVEYIKKLQYVRLQTLKYSHQPQELRIKSCNCNSYSHLIMSNVCVKMSNKLISQFSGNVHLMDPCSLVGLVWWSQRLLLAPEISFVSASQFLSWPLWPQRINFKTSYAHNLHGMISDMSLCKLKKD